MQVEKYIISRVLVCLLTGLVLIQAAPAQQVLEEVIVTAQRREQSLQEVPISIEAYSGAEILRQGFRDLEALGVFSPTVVINNAVQDQFISIRGFGTSGNSLTLEQAVPIFLDGVHFGRQSQAKIAFLDVESVEVLKGPQPVFFGQNVTAGAFNIQSRKPTPEWETNLDFEAGNNSTLTLNAGAGGPISDNWGVRFAGKYDRSSGYMRNVVTDDKTPGYENFGGRTILQWTPTENFRTTAKFEAAKISKGSADRHICLTEGTLIYNRQGPGPLGNDRSIWADPPQGMGWDVPHTPLDTDCFGSNKAISGGGPWFDVPDYIRENNMNSGMIDIREAADLALSKGVNGYEDINSYNGYLDFNYTFANDINLVWMTAYSRYLRDYVLDNRATPFVSNIQNRQEDFHQWSSELRATSPVGGTVEWMAGVSWQTTANDIYSNSYRANTLTGFRGTSIWEDVTWISGFTTVTFNFLGDKASLDIGGRYAIIDKEVFGSGFTSNWVFDVTPTHANAFRVDPATVRFLIPGANTANLWSIPFNASRVTPPEWRGTANAIAVGLTPFDSASSNGPYHQNFDSKEIDPQVTLRYRHTDDLSLFARWAQSFKAGGFDTGQNTLPATLEEFQFGPENAETFEAGVKGAYWEGRGRYDITAFRLTFNNLQLTTLSPDPLQVSASTNAGQQRVQGIEFGTQMLLTEQLRLGLAGAFMDGKMTSYAGAGCNDAEIAAAPESGCDLATTRIDRSGSQSPNTPDYKFVLSLDYEMPVFDQHLAYFDVKAYLSDGYFNDITGFTRTNSYDRHGDVNLAIGLGNLDDIWRVSVFARNLLQARPTYHPEVDIPDDGFNAYELGPSAFTTYGIKFEYDFR